MLPQLNNFPPNQELNVNKLTVTMDKNQYGVRLKAQPNHMKMGKELKKALGTITPLIKALTSKDIEK